MIVDWTIFVPVVGGVIRNLSGWIENALQDGQITSYEFRQLIATTIQVCVIAYASMYGIGLDAISATGIGILGSLGISAVKKAGTK